MRKTYPSTAVDRFDVSILIGLPRIAGTPEEVAADVRRRALAKSYNVVYVGAYVRRRPAKRNRAKRAA
jgi:hypothetical protein